MSSPGVLALPGPTYCYRYDGDFIINGRPIVVHQEGGQGRGTGWAVWDGAAAAAKYLEAAASDILRGTLSGPPPQTVLELGSGTGLAGLAAAAALQLPACLTDLPEALPALQRNIQANPQLAALVSAVPLDWLQPQGSPALASNSGAGSSGAGSSWAGSSGRNSSGGSGSASTSGDGGSMSAASSSSAIGGCRSSQSLASPRLVLAADCVWLESLVAPFVRTLELATSHPGDRALLAYQSRSTRVDSLLDSFLKAAFEVQPAAPLPGEPPRGAIELYWLTPRGSSAAAGKSSGEAGGSTKQMPQHSR